MPRFAKTSTFNLLGSREEFATMIKGVENDCLQVEDVKRILFSLKSKPLLSDECMKTILDLCGQLSYDGVLLIHDCLSRKWKHGLTYKSWDSIVEHSSIIKWGSFIQPTGYKYTDAIPSSIEYICEPCYRGKRIQVHSSPLVCIAFDSNGKVVQLNWNLKQTMILDAVLAETNQLFVFDILMLNNINLMQLPLRVRKEYLESIIFPINVVIVRQTTRLENVIFKKQNEMYLPKKKIWLKLK